MYKYDYYTGEPLEDGSPPNELSQDEITQNANLTGFYDLDPNQRYMTQQMAYQQQYYNPGMNGYNQQSGFSGYVGAPYMNPPQPQPGQVGLFGQSPYQQAPQYHDQTIVIPPFNTGSELLLKTNAEEECNKLDQEKQAEMEESYLERLAKQREYMNEIGMYSSTTNYVNPFNPAIENKYRKKVEEMREEAQEARIEINKGFSRLVDRFTGDGEIDEERIDELYKPHVVTIPGSRVQEDSDIQRFNQAVVIDPTEVPRQEYAEASAEYNKKFTNETTMDEFFAGVGDILRDEAMEEEAHRRRDFSGLYQQNGSYKALIQQKALEKKGYTNQGGGFQIPNMNGQNIPMGNMTPTLDQSAKLLDDGTLKISAPGWLGNKQFVVTNQNEDDYDIQRNRFVESIYRDDPRPGGVPNGS